MLFKEKLLLANCDSVMKRPKEELNKRFKMGLLFAEGIILSTNVLIDNNSIDSIFQDNTIKQYLLSNEGHGKLVIRGRGLEDNQPLIDFYHNLPDNFIFSSFNGKLKNQLSFQETEIILNRLKIIDEIIHNSQALKESIDNSSTSALSEQLIIRSESYFKDFNNINFKQSIDRFQKEFKTIKTRSQAYHLSEIYFTNKLIREKIRTELIDPAYNHMFVKSGEGFVQDRIKVFSNLPTSVINSGMTLRQHKQKIELILEVWDILNLIHSFGSTTIYDILEDKALDYIESKLVDSGKNFLTRKNWYGMYNKMSNSLGVEV